MHTPSRTGNATEGSGGKTGTGRREHNSELAQKKEEIEQDDVLDERDVE
jgi:hypothetical protein